MEHGGRGGEVLGVEDGRSRSGVRPLGPGRARAQRNPGRWGLRVTPDEQTGGGGGPGQRSLAGIGDENDIPHEVTFCAVDLEGPWKDGEILEIGAVEVEGRRSVGTFETFVQPSGDIPLEIQMLTGITLGTDALPLPAVLPNSSSSADRRRSSQRSVRSRSSTRRAGDSTTRSPSLIVDTVRLAPRPCGSVPRAGRGRSSAPRSARVARASRTVSTIGAAEIP